MNCKQIVQFCAATQLRTKLGTWKWQNCVAWNHTSKTMIKIAKHVLQFIIFLTFYWEVCGSICSKFIFDCHSSVILSLYDAPMVMNLWNNKKGTGLDSLPTFCSFWNDIGRNDVHWPVFDRRRQSMKRYMFSEPVNYVWLLLTMKNVFFFLLLFFICCITNIKKINPCLCKIYEKFRFSVKKEKGRYRAKL